MSRYHQRREEELEAEIEQSRAHLDDTLHELESRLSPTKLKHDLARYMPRRNGAAAGFFDSLGRSIRDNPAPVLLTGVGLGWLIVSQLRSRKASRHARLPVPVAHGGTLPVRQEAPQRMVATHMGTQQGRGELSSHRPDVIGEATHLGTGQGWSGYVYPNT
ncbi:DUF3618 domain-containing protein [Billgrantia sp. LNSP4103-1]|uniref:DUF3618 domain-containing protein n=1 Tax=Billgrantia sp. LNSP4103-1 TaxID=3410266 RepID=UPI00403F315E